MVGWVQAVWAPRKIKLDGGHACFLYHKDFMILYESDPKKWLTNFLKARQTKKRLTNFLKASSIDLLVSTSGAACDHEAKTSPHSNRKAS